MVALFYVGAPTMLFAVVAELTRTVVHVSFVTRLAVLMLPTLLGGIYMFWWSSQLC